MAKKVNLDEELQQAPEVPSFEIPKVRETPEGWSSYPNMPGETWYERALAFQKWSGHPPIPLSHIYDENWNVLTIEEYNEKHKDDVPEFVPDEVSEQERIEGVDKPYVPNPEYEGDKE